MGSHLNQIIFKKFMTNWIPTKIWWYKMSNSLVRHCSIRLQQ